MSVVDTLRRAADRVLAADCAQCEHSHRDHMSGRPYPGCVHRSCDCTSWTPSTSREVAVPLAAWLRVEAELAENPLCAVVEGVPQPLVAWVPATARPYALALARAILGETGDPDE
jgi:hypothetical protein